MEIGESKSEIEEEKVTAGSNQLQVSRSTYADAHKQKYLSQDDYFVLLPLRSKIIKKQKS